MKEVYNNTFSSTYPNIGTDVSEAAWMVHMRGGTALIFNNTANHFNSLCVMQAFRTWQPASPWGAANGVNVWDENSPTLYASGTHTGSKGATTLTDSSKTWTTNQWAKAGDGCRDVVLKRV